MNVNVTITSNSNISAYCSNNHPLQMVIGRWAMCDNCYRCGLNPSWACIACDFDLCRECASQNAKPKTQKVQYVQNFQQSYNYRQNYIPTNSQVKFFDRNHQSHLFVGNSVTENDHQVYSCQQKLFNPQNFPKRTAFVITQTQDGYYQIMDSDHQAFLFVGNGLDNGGDHTVWACPQNKWKDYNDFMFRTSFSFITADGGVRILDRKHNSYIFVGNSDDGGDHTLYSVPVTKFNQNTNEWAKRTVFAIEGGQITPFVPTYRAIRMVDVNHQSTIFVGNGVTDNDHNVYSCQQKLFQPQNYATRTGLVIVPTNDGSHQIYDQDKQAYFFVGNSVDNGGDHTVWACPQNKWKDYNDFMFRTSFTIQPAENGCWRLLDKKHNSYVFVGNSDDGGDHTLYSVPVNKYNQNPGEWGKRTLWIFN